MRGCLKWQDLKDRGQPSPTALGTVLCATIWVSASRTRGPPPGRAVRLPDDEGCDLVNRRILPHGTLVACTPDMMAHPQPTRRKTRKSRLKVVVSLTPGPIPAYNAGDDPIGRRCVPVNLNQPQKWKADVATSVDMYNEWFMKFAPVTYRETRVKTTKDVEETLHKTKNLTDIKVNLLRAHPGVLPTLRMSTCPPIALDRLVGLAGISKNLALKMEEGCLPPRMSPTELQADLEKIGALIEKLADPDIFVWLNPLRPATEIEIHRAATIVADRLCGAVANPIIRNAQEQRQLAKIGAWLGARGYKPLPEGIKFDAMPPGTYSVRLNVPVNVESKVEGGAITINIPVDTIVMPMTAIPGTLPIMIEAKSAGDFTNTNKRRKEEAQKINQLRHTFDNNVRFVLFLCGYFDTGYLGYEAAESIDWVWEHRIDDFALLGL